jgi:hypothetical protein
MLPSEPPSPPDAEKHLAALRRVIHGPYLWNLEPRAMLRDVACLFKEAMEADDAYVALIAPLDIEEPQAEKAKEKAKAKKPVGWRKHRARTWAVHDTQGRKLPAADAQLFVCHAFLELARKKGGVMTATRFLPPPPDPEKRGDLALVIEHIICAPLLDKAGGVQGVLYAIRRAGLTAEDLAEASGQRSAGSAQPGTVDAHEPVREAAAS